MEFSIVSIGGFSLLTILFGVFGFIWGNKRAIKKLIPGKTDDKIINTIANVSEKMNIPIDDLAKEGRQDLKKAVKDKLFLGKGK